MVSFARFFTYVQDAPWYDHFLEPVLGALRPLPPNSKLCDIGTGAGKLLELAQTQLGLEVVGSDTDAEMLAQARKRPSLASTPLHLLEKDQPLPFADDSFDAVTICSVLFLLDDPEPLLQEAMRVLRPNGRLIILTPTGNGRLHPTLFKQIGPSVHNWTFFMWRRMTAGSGRSWATKSILPTFAAKNQLTYHKQGGFQAFAVVEILTFEPNPVISTAS
jgi:ubiquinone/menaquinone biosynthesis C-methylase UbiE